MKINWRLNELLEDASGKLSSARLFMLLVAISAIIDWQHAIWMIDGGIWRPMWQTVGLILGVLGFKIAQKIKEPGE